MLDAELLARIQFAANISFHILFPSLTIGLAWVLLFFRIRFTQTQDELWEQAYMFWVKVFALTFAIGVVSGITMSFQFGTNWPGFMEKAGNIAGPLLGYEVLTAFFLEASFLGIMLYGRRRVSNRWHLIATLLVAVGTTLSAFWILSLNSWMQTPAGYRIEDGVFFVESWMAVIFNPSFPYRLAHTLLASVLTCAFVMMGLSAWQLKQHASKMSAAVLKVAIWIAVIAAPLQVLVGDFHGLNTFEHQPQKVAAMEAVWDTEAGAPFTVVAWPDEASRSNRFAIEIPMAASLILTHELDGEIRGLNEFEGNHPPVAPVFFAFRLMLAVGGLMVLLAAWAFWCVVLKPRPLGQWLQSAMIWMTFSGWVAVLAGWYVTEVGRQPWIVYGLLTVQDVVADHPASTVLTTLIAYLLLYVFIMASYIVTLRHMAKRAVAAEPSKGAN